MRRTVLDASAILAALNRKRARLEKAYTDAWLATTDASQTHRAAPGAQIQDLNERIGEHRGVDWLAIPRFYPDTRQAARGSHRVDSTDVGGVGRVRPW